MLYVHVIYINKKLVKFHLEITVSLDDLSPLSTYGNLKGCIQTMLT